MIPFIRDNVECAVTTLTTNILEAPALPILVRQALLYVSQLITQPISANKSLG